MTSNNTTLVPPPHRVAIIGLGFQGRNLAEAVVATAGLELAMVVPGRDHDDLPVHIGERLIPSATIAEVLSDDAVQMVLIATPNDTHAEIALLCLKADKHVFVEKPLVLTVDDLKQVRHAAAQSNRTVVTGHALRTAPGVERLLRLIMDGAIGKVLSIDAQRLRLLPSGDPTSSWKHDPRRSGGETLHEIHELDLMCLLGGEVATVKSLTSGTGKEDEQKAHHSLIEFVNGTIGQHTVAANSHHHKWTLSVLGTDGSLVLDFQNALVSHYRANHIVAEWTLFGEPAANDSLIESSKGEAKYNAPGTIPIWMKQLALDEMGEVEQILSGSTISILLADPYGAARAALMLISSVDEKSS